MPEDLLQVVQQQLRNTCERLVWMLDLDVLCHAERLVCLLIVLSRFINSVAFSISTVDCVL